MIASMRRAHPRAYACDENPPAVRCASEFLPKEPLEGPRDRVHGAEIYDFVPRCLGCHFSSVALSMRVRMPSSTLARSFQPRSRLSSMLRS